MKTHQVEFLTKQHWCLCHCLQHLNKCPKKLFVLKQKHISVDVVTVRQRWHTRAHTRTLPGCGHPAVVSIQTTDSAKHRVPDSASTSSSTPPSPALPLSIPLLSHDDYAGVKQRAGPWLSATLQCHHVWHAKIVMGQNSCG